MKKPRGKVVNFQEYKENKRQLELDKEELLELDREELLNLIRRIATTK